MGPKGEFVIGAPHLTCSASMKPKTKLSTLETLYASVPAARLRSASIKRNLGSADRGSNRPTALGHSKLHAVRSGRCYRKRQTDAARALVTFLSSPAAQAVLRAKGFE